MEERIRRARTFAIAAHEAVGQTRKYTREPYWKHCERVADAVRAVTDDVIGRQAAWLHDVLEDTEVTYDTIREELGLPVAVMVLGLTAPPVSVGNRKERMVIYRTQLAAATGLVQTIKVADLIDNTWDIVDHDPAFARVYLKEKWDLLMVLDKASTSLQVRAWRQLASAQKRLEEEELK